MPEVTREEFERQMSQPQNNQGGLVSKEEFYRQMGMAIPTASSPSIIGETLKSIPRSLAQTAQSLGGAGVEMVGAGIASLADLTRVATAQPTDTRSPVEELFSRGQQTQQVLATPTENPFEGQRQMAEQVFGPVANAPSLQQNPQAAEATYLGGAPVGTKLAKLGSDVVQAGTSMVPVIAGFASAGPLGAGAMGGVLEAAGKYEESKQAGLSDEQALAEAATVGAGSAVLNSIPFMEKIAKFVPKPLQGRIGNFVMRGIAEAGTETAEGGLNPFAEVASGRRKVNNYDDMVQFWKDVATGAYNESSVIPASFITGGIGAGGATQANINQEAKAFANEVVSGMEQKRITDANRLLPSPEQVGAPQLGFRGVLNAQGEPIFTPNPGPGDVQPDSQIGPGVAPTGQARQVSLEEIFQGIRAQKQVGVGEVGPTLTIEDISKALEIQKALQNIGEGVVPSSAGQTESIPAAPGEMQLVPGQSPFTPLRRSPLSIAATAGANTPITQPFVGERPIQAPENRMTMPYTQNKTPIDLPPSINPLPSAGPGPFSPPYRPGIAPLSQLPIEQSERGDAPPALPPSNINIERIGEQSAAEFAGWQERPRGKEPIALYNIPVEGGGKTTVSAETAAERGFVVPEPTTPKPESVVAKNATSQDPTSIREEIARIENSLPRQERNSVPKEEAPSLNSKQRQDMARKQYLESLTEEQRNDVFRLPELRTRLESEESLAEGKQRNEKRKAWLGNKLVARYFENRLKKEGISYSRQDADGGSIYFDVNGEKVRIADHEAPTGGGFSQERQQRMGDADIDINPYSGVKWQDAFSRVARQVVAKEASSPQTPRELAEERIAKREDYPFESPQAAVSPRESIQNAIYEAGGKQLETRVRLADLREALPNVPRKQLDETLKQMQTDGDLVLYRNDDPQDMTPRDRGAQLMLGNDPRDLVYLKKAPGEVQKAPQNAPGATISQQATGKQAEMDEVRRKREAGEISHSQMAKEHRRIIGKYSRKNEDSGFLNIGAFVDAASKVPQRALDFVLSPKPYLRFKGGLRDAKALSVEKTGNNRALLEDAQQVVTDLSNAYRSTLSGPLSAFRQIPDQLRETINDYMTTPDGAKRQQYYSEIPEPMRPHVMRMREIQDSLSRQLVKEGVVPDETAQIILSNEGVYLRQTYKIFTDPDWKKNVPEQFKANMRALIKKWHPEYSEAQLHDAVNDWLNVAKDESGRVIFSGRTIGQKDLSTLKRRNQFPKEVLDLWGVEKDGIVRFMDSVQSTAHMLTNHRFMKQVAEAGMGKYVFDRSYFGENGKNRNDPTYERLAKEGVLVPMTEGATLGAEDLVHRGKYYESGSPKLETRKSIKNEYSPLGAMADTRVHKDFKAALEKHMRIDIDNPWLAALIEFNALSKSTQTILDPDAHALNLFSNVFFGAANGYFGIGYETSTAQRMKTAMQMASVDVLGHLHNPEYRAQRNRAIEVGALHDTDVAGEQQHAFRESQRKGVIGRVGKHLPKELRQVVGKHYEYLNRLYQAGDDVWKAFAWLSETEYEMKANPGIGRAEAEKIAGERVRMLLPTYTETHTAVRAFRRIPFFGPFVSFSSEVPRNAINTYVTIENELRSGNPVRMRMAFNRIAGAAATAAALSVPAMLMAAKLDLDDDDQKALQLGLSEFYDNAAIAWMSVDRKTGKAHGNATTRFNPYGTLMEPFVAATRADNSLQGAKEFMAEGLRPFYSEELGWGILDDLINNRNRFDNPIVQASDTTSEAAMKQASYALNALLPGTFRRVPSELQKENPDRRMAEVALGQRTVDVDLPKSLRYEVLDGRDVVSGAKSDLNKAIRSGDESAILEQWRQLLVADEAAFDRAHKLVAGMEHFGVDRTLTISTLRDIKVSDEDISRYISGAYVAPARPREVAAIENRKKYGGQ